MNEEKSAKNTFQNLQMDQIKELNDNTEAPTVRFS